MPSDRSRQPPRSPIPPMRGAQLSKRRLATPRPTAGRHEESARRSRRSEPRGNWLQRWLGRSRRASRPAAPPPPPETATAPAPLPPSPAELRQRQRQRPALQVVPDPTDAPAPTPSPPAAAGSSFLTVFALYATRLLIASIGLGAIVGTLIATRDSTRHAARHTAPPTAEVAAVEASRYPSVLPARQANTTLETALADLLAQYPQAETGVFLLDLDTGAYVDWQATQRFSAASTIKLPIAIAFFQAVDAGEVRLDERLTMTPELIAGEAGEMQYEAPGTQFTALETAVQMIAISDNTATNMLIERLGGAEQLNRRFAEWGLQSTQVANWLPDLEGANATSPLDLAYLLAAIHRGELVSLPSRDRLLDILRQVEHNDLLPQGLEEGATIAHKTGRIRSLLADAGLIDTPTGKRYIAAVMVKRPDGDEQAAKLIQEISRLAYEQFNSVQPLPAESEDSIEPSDSVAATEEETQN